MEGSDDGNSLVNVNVLEQEDTEYTMYLTRAELSRNIYGDRLQPPVLYSRCPLASILRGSTGYDIVLYQCSDSIQR